MKIWIDADACPNPVKEIIFRASKRLSVPVVLVANHALRVPPGPLIRAIQVPHGFDVADDHIVSQVESGDIVVTQDIPLAAELVPKGVAVINPRGMLYTPENIRQRLAVRDMMEELRSSGQVTGGPSAFGPKEKQAFANTLDRLLAEKTRRR